VQIVCLDLEGVLVPEIWIAFAQRSGIPELRRTTRDEPDYDKLMRFRIDLLKRHALGLPDIQRVIADLGPEPGARAFLDELRRRYQVVILSDTFYEFAMPLMAQLGMPTIFCHRLETDPRGFLVRHHLRLAEQKRAAVKAFRGLAFKVIAAGVGARQCLDNEPDSFQCDAVAHRMKLRAGETLDAVRQRIRAGSGSEHWWQTDGELRIEDHEFRQQLRMEQDGFAVRRVQRDDRTATDLAAGAGGGRDGNERREA